MSGGSCGSERFLVSLTCLDRVTFAAKSRMETLYQDSTSRWEGDAGRTSASAQQGVGRLNYNHSFPGLFLGACFDESPIYPRDLCFLHMVQPARPL